MLDASIRESDRGAHVPAVVRLDDDGEHILLKQICQLRRRGHGQILTDPTGQRP